MSGKKDKILLLICLSVLLASLYAVPAYAAGAEDDGGNYIGPGGCKFCHIEKYEAWSKTNHSRAFERLVERNQTTNASCLPCHSTGFNSKTKTYKFRDVTCEVCHGSGDISNNIVQQVIEITYSLDNKSQEEIHDLLAQLNLTKKSMVKNLSAEMCGRCHQGDHRPTYEEWNKSKHAQSLVDIKKNKGGKTECLECHSSQYITAEERNKPTLATATVGNTCPACHNVHGSTNPKLLRKPKNVLCESCHYTEGAKPGSAPHHAQSEMRRSFGGVDTDTYIYQPTASCADCHRYTSQYNRTGIKEPAITGHDFKINFNVCLKCHEGFSSAEDAKIFVENQQATIMEQYNSTILKVNDARNITARIGGSEKDIYWHVYNESVFDIQLVSADKSKGAHNPKYAMELIEKADLKAANIILGQPDKTVQPLPGFGFLPGFVALLAALLVLAKRQQK